MAYKPGQSGNLSGRPKDSPEVIAAKQLARSKCLAAIQFHIDIMENEAHDIKFRMQAAQVLLDRGMGTPGREPMGEDGMDGMDRPVTLADLNRAIEKVLNSEGGAG